MKVFGYLARLGLYGGALLCFTPKNVMYSSRFFAVAFLLTAPLLTVGCQEPSNQDDAWSSSSPSVSASEASAPSSSPSKSETIEDRVFKAVTDAYALVDEIFKDESRDVAELKHVLEGDGLEYMRDMVEEDRKDITWVSGDNTIDLLSLQKRDEQSWLVSYYIDTKTSTSRQQMES